MIYLIVLLTFATMSSGQLLFHQPLPLAFRAQQQVPVAHRAVIENSLRESQLPDELVNKFYKDPRIADALAKESWFTSKEMPVYDREADKIPRTQVYKLFRDAGFIKRRR